MTTTKYKYTMNFNGGIIVMNENEWPKFTSSILTSCTFKVGIGSNKSKKYVICDFEARYYDDQGIRHFHLTNDARRKVRRFLAVTYWI